MQYGSKCCTKWRASCHTYIVMPPGSGKTMVDLEIARRLGNRVLALGPNTAIQAQWLAQWQEFQPRTLAAGTGTTLATPITALTYRRSLAGVGRRA